MYQKLLLLGLLFLFGTVHKSSAQMPKFKALFLYNFTQNVDWPTSATSGSEFIVTVVGDKEMAKELKNLAKVKKVGTKTLVIKEANALKDIETSHVVFLGSSKSNLMSQLKSQQANVPVLLISSKEGLCEQGAGISFMIASGKLRYQICEANINDQGLQVNSKLLSLGTVVK
ncbi:YfiR family protein [Carboxylicivirga sp. N1Y90]|uniref:YfiR family protein n=1 Tax=Carboxylicivirga fragile TaxID=3417571 RepID=UPI003D337162|nr:YfiR family protein [Marinilabiliaceae bacterium N1Y90]